MICNLCNTNMIWQSDFMPDEYGIEDREGIISHYMCPVCDRDVSYLITDTGSYIIFYDVDGSIVLLNKK